MIKPLPLYPGAQPCVGSGFCCKQAPCQFGKATGPDNSACVYLKAIDTKYGSITRYTCGIYDDIVGKPGWELAPAFGSGCCSSLFNADRIAILRAIHDHPDIDDALTEHHRKHH